MTILADMRRLENENRLLGNLLKTALETSAELRKTAYRVCPLVRYWLELEEKE